MSTAAIDAHQASIPSHPLRSVGLIVRSARVRSLARLRLDSHSRTARVPPSHPISPTTPARHDARPYLTPLYPPHSLIFLRRLPPNPSFSDDTPPHLASPCISSTALGIPPFTSLDEPKRHCDCIFTDRADRADPSYIVDFALARPTACVSTLHPSYTYIVSHLSWTYVRTDFTYLDHGHHYSYQVFLTCTHCLFISPVHCTL
ncbi:hypothetical protein B0H14DRAFT_847038 [Mycena olivaceomarginata]|nr:hypothetical protein B0H14DRAFT_847038 [Mycena olivaceomarginata]